MNAIKFSININQYNCARSIDIATRKSLASIAAILGTDTTLTAKGSFKSFTLALPDNCPNRITALVAALVGIARKHNGSAFLNGNAIN